MNALSTLLSLPFAKMVLAFEALPLSRACKVCRSCYQGVYPYVELGSAGYVRWAVDSLENLLEQPHAEDVDEALMYLAAHAGEAEASLCESEMLEELQRLCRHLRLVPPTGQEAVRLAMLGLLEDVVSGRLPAGRDQAALNCLHEWLANDAGAPALEALERCYWQLDEYEDLSKLGLEQGLPDRRELLDDFRELASTLVEGMAVALEPREDGFCRLCIRMPQEENEEEEHCPVQPSATKSCPAPATAEVEEEGVVPPDSPITQISRISAPLHHLLTTSRHPMTPPRFTSDTARHFIRQWGEAPQARDPYGETLLHALACSRLRAAEYRDFMTALRSGWRVDTRGSLGDPGCSVLDAAVDARAEASLFILLREAPERLVLLHALGDQLSQYSSVGSARMDARLFSFLTRLGNLSADECSYLLRRALEGAAWPYALPFFVASGEPLPAFSGLIPWEWAQNPVLLKHLEADLEQLGSALRAAGQLPPGSLFAWEAGQLRPRLECLRWRGPGQACPRSFYGWRRLIKRGMKLRAKHGLWYIPRHKTLTSKDARLLMGMLCACAAGAGKREEVRGGKFGARRA